MDPKNCEKLVAEHIGQHGRLDILVNNASKQFMTKDLADIDVRRDCSSHMSTGIH